MNIRKLAKKNARLSLSGKWGRAVTLTIILFATLVVFKIIEQLLYMCFQLNPAILQSVGQSFLNSDSRKIYFISIFVSIFYYLLINPLVIGEKKWYSSNISGFDPPLSTTFDFFSSAHLYIKSLLLKINISIRMFLFVVVYLAPSFLVVWSSGINWDPYEYISSFQLLLLLLGLILAFFGLMAFVYTYLRYFLVDYIFIQNEDMKIREILKLSTDVMKPHKLDVIKLILSFALFYLSMILIFPALFVLPYTRSTFAIYAKVYLSEYQTNKKEVLQNEK